MPFVLALTYHGNCQNPRLFPMHKLHGKRALVTAGTHTTPESAKATVDGIPLGRGGNADDVARAAVFLASEYDGFITGATVDINGGVYAC
jgi:NAD(P)-dependent dehydrogenase (short-subunit alcohol dehydrogenase family)